MKTEIWIAIAIAAIGTYLIRVVPLLWTQRHFNKQHTRGSQPQLPTSISVLGPLMIAAMLGVSIVPKFPSVDAWIATAVGTLTTILLWRKTNSLGIPVLGGVILFAATYGLVPGLGDS